MFTDSQEACGDSTMNKRGEILSASGQSFNMKKTKLTDAIRNRLKEKKLAEKQAGTKSTTEKTSKTKPISTPEAEAEDDSVMLFPPEDNKAKIKKIAVIAGILVGGGLLGFLIYRRIKK